MKKTIVIAVSLILLVGCKSSNLADVVGQLKDDHSNLELTLVTPWGQQIVRRSNPWAPWQTNPPALTVPAAILPPK